MDLAQPYTIDDELLERTIADRQPRYSVRVPEREVVVVGRHCDVALEVHLQRCKEEGVPVLRRRSGGGTVVLGPGQVVVALFLPVVDRGRQDRHLDRVSAWLLGAIQQTTGIGAHKAGFSDFAVGDRKVAGSGMLWSRHVLYYSASILVDYPLHRIEALLPYPPKEPDYRQGRPHLDFVANLSHYAPGLTAPALATRLKATLSLQEL